ncbi:oxidoreductase [Campylobacter hyointestinalis]|uniref:oxidoreductase n=1 Tax=Campylobacter hyointestinalis TaxID=198 RepID=UPI000CE4E38B|nr:oxidoreductase [Campylobacter hyointestinalis]PPB53520.1 flagellin modification protein A [Campylobacter hyointestinalis subsp. hyointestinalis]PPB66251.1 flagellin modification protein A [Campylobacter hyointestinalis subsp. hyointestinalis]PPB70957.1 flagellin modification protein A [Campylobacter hyointestinalis subsp. hyointestinalis]
MLKDKVIVIIGGVGTIGKEFVKSILQNNAIAIIADVNEDLGLDFIDEIESQFGKNRAEFIKFDIASKACMQECIAYLSDKFGKINAVVNAAYPRTKTFGNHFFDVEYNDFCINTNLQLGGAFLVMQQFASYFKTQGYGNIISLSSIQGVVAPKFETYNGTNMSSPVAYAAIKAGVIHMTKYVAKYLKGTNIRVNCISPGGILAGQNETFLKQYKDVCLSKGMLDANDLNGALIFLLSDGSRYINGQNIVVDDGFCL